MKNQGTAFVYKITLVATLGGLLFGYDTAVISGAEGSLHRFFAENLGLNSFIHGITVSSALIGCVIGGLLSGWLAGSLGRKGALQLAAVLFFLSALGSAYPETIFFGFGEASPALLVSFNLFRILGGIGVGLASATCPMYIAEMAPANIRGRLVSLNQFAIIFGMLVVYFVNWGIARGQEQAWIDALGWRWMFASEAIPASVFGLLLFFVPETPRFLALQQHEDKALGILRRIYPLKRAMEVLEEISQSISQPGARLFSYGRTIIVVGVLLSVFQQFVGINVVLYYAPRIFRTMAGSNTDVSLLQTVVMGVVNIIFTLVAIFTVDKFGRKPLLIIGSAGMAVGMFFIGLLSYMGIIGLSTLFFIVLYTASFMMSWGPVCWVLISEIFPNTIRARAVAIAVAAQWIANFLVSSSFPALVQFNEAWTYWLYALMSVLSALFVWKMVPETKGKTLEQMGKLWTKGKRI